MTKPIRSRARIVCVPETRGSLGIHSDLKRCDEGLAGWSQREFFQKQFRRFAKIRKSLINRFTLASGSGLGIQRRKTTFRSWKQYRGQGQLHRVSMRLGRHVGHHPFG